MIRVIFCNTLCDASLIEREMRNETADTTDEPLCTKRLDSIEMVRQCVAKREEIDIICVDVTGEDGICNAELLRGGYPEAAMLLIADVKTPPTQYMKPSIMAAALVLKPLEKVHVQIAIKQIFAKFINKENQSSCFLVENKEDTYRIPYSNILYFEARMKKIYVCTFNNEYGFYDTLDALTDKLPEEFVRCHRSYVVNRMFVKKVFKSKGMVLLQNNIEIPLSRSYKEIFGEAHV